MDHTEILREENIGIVLLAAGSSSRLGRPKQLLKYQHQTLLQHSIQAAISSIASKVIVILGAHAHAIKSEIDWHNIPIVVNLHWQEGMASSIRCGINSMIEINPAIEGIIIMVCDQPHISAVLLNKLFTTYQHTKKKIIPCGYENIIGTPVFFHRSFFPELLQLSGDMGAKNIISKHADKIAIVSFPEGKIDIDTELDYQQLQK